MSRKLAKIVARLYMQKRAAKPGPDPDKGDGLNTWFSDDSEMGDWVAISPKDKTVEVDGEEKKFEKGDILGPCGDPEGDWSDVTEDGEDPLKCMPEEKAKDMPKKERAEKAENKLKQEQKEDESQTPTYTPTLED